MGSVILDGAVIGKNSIVGAQALVPMNMTIPEGSLVLGVPAKVIKNISSEQMTTIAQSALSYQKLGEQYRAILG
jgi:carbonic anhydrase/acetyltransferase-like protein (isoleucine patch superfamily)